MQKRIHRAIFPFTFITYNVELSEIYILRLLVMRINVISILHLDPWFLGRE